MRGHYFPLLLAYVTALLGWVAIHLTLTRVPRVESLWGRAAFDPEFRRPWVELALVLLAAIGVVGLGQVYMAGLRLPAGDTAAGTVAESINQLLIFSPIIALALWRRPAAHGGWRPWELTLRSMWLPPRKVIVRIAVGFALAMLALGAFVAARENARPFLEVVGRSWAPANADLLVQVFLEDLAIAVAFVRLRGALGLGGAMGLVAVLFAAAHIPAMLAGGATWVELSHLLLDTLLGVLVLLVLRRASDVWWFFPLHFTLDMTQFHAVLPGAC